MLEVVRSFQRRVACHLGGGAALSGAHLSHRLSRDLDLFCHRLDEVRELVAAIPDVAAETGVPIRVVRDAATFVRAVTELPDRSFDIDLVYEAVPDLEPPPPPVEGIIIESLADLRASKLTCILSRSEPRDLVDLLFLERAGHRVENDLPLALQKDGGIDPGVLAWLLGQFPLEPLPEMLEPLGPDELREFRDALRERLRRLATPAG
jgi:hypothetical protein